MPPMRISGWEFPERPPNELRAKDRAEKYRQICEALDFAARACGEVDRRLYKSIREQQAFSLNLHRRACQDAPAAVRPSMKQRELSDC